MGAFLGRRIILKAHRKRSAEKGALEKVSPQYDGKEPGPTFIAHHPIQTINHSLTKGSTECAFEKGQCTEIAHLSLEVTSNALF